MTTTTVVVGGGLEQHRRVPGLDEVFYIPNFISDEDAQRVLDNIYAAPKPKWVHLKNRRLQNWGAPEEPATSELGRSSVAKRSDKCMLEQPLPSWLSPWTKTVSDLGIFGEDRLQANHVLINEYEPGQGIMPHEDGPLYVPTIATISLGSHTVLNFYDKQQRSDTKTANYDGNNASEPGNDDSLPQRTASDPALAAGEGDHDAHDTPNHTTTPIARLLLERNSLVITRGHLYTVLHGIDEVDHDVIPMPHARDAADAPLAMDCGATHAGCGFANLQLADEQGGCGDMWVYQVTDPNILNLTTSSATTTNDGDDDIVLAYALHCSPFHLPSNLPTAIDMESDAVRAALTEEPFPLCRDERTDEHRAREFVYSLCGPVDMVKECKQRIDRFLQERVRTLTLALSGSTSVDVDAIQDLCDSQGVYMRVLLSDPSYTLLLHGDADAVESVRCDIVSTCNASSPPTTSVVGSPRMQRAHPPSSAPTRHGGYTHHQAGLHAYPHTASSADTDGAMMAAMAVEQLHAVTVDSATPDTFDAFLALAQTVPGYYDCSQDIEGEDDATTFVFRFQSREGAWQMHTLCNSLKRCELGVATS
ncbi:Alkbh6 protein [Salpingoeca rosetta]|uniref:Alkbh6 protein n=1 Tax=Salpingoeca rosetta (strain ATCC 50818 / BSB-021) TaxID=946362 RepID=F2UJ26_SALR5|nr:Alkbh6 protein [Salpingoeca rosetta]EGD76974.1 Alkbh6 protein [Salpingoeca rosetta]|eukprot:XP_004990814.1 Alkbh6 protein [Salpingoeca rosetta]